MMSSNRPGAVRMAIVAVALLFASGTKAAPKVGTPAAEFHIVLLNGIRVSLSDLRGQIVLLNFWATWCAPCRKELPLLDLYYRKQQATGLKMFVVTTEDAASLSQLKPSPPTYRFQWYDTSAVVSTPRSEPSRPTTSSIAAASSAMRRPERWISQT